MAADPEGATGRRNGAPERSSQILRLADGRRIGFAEYGDPGGLPVLAIHGTPGSRYMFALTDRAARERRLRVLAPERAGYGLSDFRHQRSLAEAASDLEQCANALGLRRFALIGVSGGGPYAVAAAAAMPRRIALLALVNPVGPIAEHERRIRMSKVHRLIFTRLARSEAVCTAFFWSLRNLVQFAPGLCYRALQQRVPASDRAVLARDEVRANLRAALQEGLRPGIDGARQDLRLYCANWQLPLGDIDVPAVLWQGSDDAIVPPGAAYELAETLPNCRLDVVQGGGHYWIFSGFERVLDTARAALGGPPPRGEGVCKESLPHLVKLATRRAMKSQWNDRTAQEVVEAYAKKGVGPDIALRVYTTRLLGRDPLLVLHGGGNTSVKTRASDDLGEMHEVIAVKGSGADMADIEPWGLPAVKLEPLRRLRALDALSDEAMVNVQRLNLLDSTAPNPSVETLLHAFLPHKFIDHTHAAAVLALVDQPDGEALAREVYDGRMGIVPYIAPGFGLAKAAAEVFEAKPDVEGLILHKHGIFTFGENAREAYERMIEMVSLAESRLRQGRPVVFAARALAAASASAAEIAPIIRGAVAIKSDGAEPVRFITNFRTAPEILTYVNGAELASYSQRGVVTPDHIIRTKNKPLVAPHPEAGNLEAFARSLREAVTKFAGEYDVYFARENAAAGHSKAKLDSAPRVVLVPGVGLFGLGRTAKDASIAADLAENTIRVVTDAEAIGRYEPLPESDLFALEYWSLEQAKLKGAVAKPLTGQVALVTGAGAIGAATAKALAAEGAAVGIVDIDGERAQEAAAAVKGLGRQCDVTKPDQVKAVFAALAEHFGGIDILVSNAGAAWQGRIGDVSDETLRKSFELNFFAHQTVAQEAVRIMLKQGTGGALLFNLSKQAVNPGANFGPYGLPKAAAMLLMRQYALDYGAEGIRSNGVNADRVRSGLLTDAMIKDRAKARGVSEAEYMAGNLLQAEVTAADVAQAFVVLAKARKTTGHIETVDGGNIAASLR